MCHDIYISFGGDQRAFVDRLTQALHEIDVSVQHEETILRGPGAAESMREISQYCSCTIACWSPSTIACPQVNAEADAALSSKALAHLIASPCAPPPRFAPLDAPDLSTWNGELDHPSFLSLLTNIAQTKFCDYLDNLPATALARARGKKADAVLLLREMLIERARSNVEPMDAEAALDAFYELAKDRNMDLGTRCMETLWGAADELTIRDPKLGYPPLTALLRDNRYADNRPYLTRHTLLKGLPFDVAMKVQGAIVEEIKAYWPFSGE